ncbi:outer membrane lipoprotein carrier protein LolA [Otariodibacter sp.]|uniref:LolA family protein n=1 Tax=Otariodibacter sp. TaxID=3030919 RepID=UPI0026246FF8|nr:outer membrane lipoprotein carrier protein LolA [Otariodibacter sp.]
MKKYIIALALFLFSSLSFGFSQADLFELLQKPNNTQGNFTQNRFLKALKNPIVISGEFSLIKNQGLLWHTQKPFDNYLRVTKSGINQWNGKSWVDNNKLGESEQVSLFLGLLSGNTDALDDQFQLSLRGSDAQWQLTLIPESLLMKQIFTEIVLNGDEVVKQIELKEKQGDRTLIQFKDIKLNAPVSAFTQNALKP